MGVAVSKAHSDLLAPGKEAKVAVKEQLEFLVCMANNRLDRYQSELEA